MPRTTIEQLKRLEAAGEEYKQTMEQVQEIINQLFKPEIVEKWEPHCIACRRIFETNEIELTLRLKI